VFDAQYFEDWVILLAEWATIPALAVAFAAVRWARRDHWVTAPVRWLLANERRPLVTVFLLALVTGVVSSAIRPAWPFIHDEYSYLLAGDTFAHGRITNPPHPFWKHFETFHVLQQPSYQSKYPPAQGLVLALGQVVFGHPIVGVWLSLAFACVALYWCLRAWAARGWSLFGATLPCIRFGSGPLWDSDLWAYWAASYWGGAVAFLGACLAFGAMPRLLRKPGWKPSLLLGLGFGILAASRPFEGLLVALLISAFLCVGFLRKTKPSHVLSAVAPGAFVVTLCLATLSYYNWRVTGSPFTTPYTVYLDMYDVVPLFTFQELSPEPNYRHEILRRFQLEFMVPTFRQQQGEPLMDIHSGRILSGFFLGTPLALVTFLGLYWRSRWLLLVMLTLGTAALSHAVTLPGSGGLFRPHYFAPFAPALLLLTIRGLRLLRTFRFGRHALGTPITRVVVVSCVVVFVAAAALRLHQQWPAIGRWNRPEFIRRRFAERLPETGPKHLVFVRYGLQHNIHREWVYNPSEIDAAPIVWAREMAPADNRALRDYYRDRKAWVLEPDQRPPRLLPYE